MHINTLTLNINPQTQSKTVTVEMDADKLEKLAASLGLFTQDVIDSLEHSEKDYQEGRFRKINSLQDIA